MALVIIVSETQHELLRDAVGTLRTFLGKDAPMAQHRDLDALFERLALAFPAHSELSLDRRALAAETEP